MSTPIYIPTSTSTGVTLAQMQQYVIYQLDSVISNYMPLTGGTVNPGPLTITNTTPNTALIANGSKNIASSSVSSTTLGYLDATSSVQTQLNSKQNALSGLTSGDHIIATGTSSLGNSSILSESGGTLTANGSVAVVNSSSTGFTVGYGGNTYFVVNTSTPSVYVGGTTPSILYTSKISTTNPGSNVALITDGSYNIAGSTTTSTELSYVHGVTSAIQTQLNGKQASLSGLTSGDYIKATGSGSIGNASVLSESGTTVSASGTLTVTSPTNNVNAFQVNNSSGNNILRVDTSNNTTTVSSPGNNGVAFQVQNSSSHTIMGVDCYYPSFYVNNDQGAYLIFANNQTAVGYVGFGAPNIGSPTVYDNIYIQRNIMSPGAGPGSGVFALGSSSRFFGSIYVNNVIGNGTILYNYNNSSAGTGYPTMDALYTFEYIVTASNIPASATMVGGFIPFPAGKSGANLRKLDVSMYDGTYFVPALFGIITPQYAFGIASSPSGIFIDTGSTWTQTTGSKTFYVWITTN